MKTRPVFAVITALAFAGALVACSAGGGGGDGNGGGGGDSASNCENEIKNPKIKFEYYGLPKPPDAWKDPEVKRLGVTGVPTGVVYVNGIQAGRLEKAAWNAPEVELSKILNGGGTKGK